MPSATKADLARYARLLEHGCVCCRILNPPPIRGGRVEMHHIISHGYRSHSGGNLSTIPLCSWHHRSEPPSIVLSKRETRMLLGPALADGKKPFVARWGTERELLDRVNREIYGQAAIPGEGSPIDDVG